MEEMEEIKCARCGRTCKECGLDTLGIVEGIGVIPLRELVEEEYERWFVCGECWNGKKSEPASPDELQLVRTFVPGRTLDEAIREADEEEETGEY